MFSILYTALKVTAMHVDTIYNAMFCLYSLNFCHTIKSQDTDCITQTLCVKDLTVSGVYWDLRGLK